MREGPGNEMLRLVSNAAAANNVAFSLRQYSLRKESNMSCDAAPQTLAKRVHFSSIFHV